MSRKHLLVLLLLGVGGAVAYLGWKTAQGIQQKQRTQAALERLPRVSLMRADSTPIELSAWVGGQEAVLFFFHPDCEHCQSEARALKAYRREFEQTKILWIATTDSLAAIRAFEATYGLTEVFPALTMARLSPEQANETFGLRSFPTIFIYGKDGQLLQKYVGETKMEAILKHLSNP